MKIYRKSFGKHDSDVESGQKKINASTLYPYDIIREFLYNRSNVSNDTKSLDLQWNNLPKYMDECNDTQCMVLADVSGSMTCGCQGVVPLHVSISLAINFAERMKGPFNGIFMTFTSTPVLVKLQGKDITEKAKIIFVSFSTKLST